MSQDLFDLVTAVTTVSMGVMPPLVLEPIQEVL